MNSPHTFKTKFYHLLSSMRFAVSLLSLLGIASIIGTVLKQNEPYENYIIKFGQFWFGFFENLGLYDVYHSTWFLLILVFLVISCSLCIYRNGPSMIQEWRAYKDQATEKSFQSFSHQQIYPTQNIQDVKQKLMQYLDAIHFKYKITTQSDGSEMIAAKSGTHQRLGYLFTHSAIVIICFGGLLDGNLPFKVQELLGQKRLETLDLPESKVPEISRLGINNPSFRANMTLPEGVSDNVAFVKIRDGYLVQELPFTVALKDFRIEHYATGQPKSFESDIVIIDPDLAKPLTKTISVNHPLIYKGIAIYQSDFQDGGTKLKFNVWNLLGPSAQPQILEGAIFQKGTLSDVEHPIKVEFNDFRLFNIINLSADGKGKPHNVGPNITYKMRDAQGQAKEYVTYMQPMQIDGQYYFISGMRETVQEDFKYLRIPVDDDFSIQGFMHFRAVMMDSHQFNTIANRLAQKAVEKNQSLEMQEKLKSSVTSLLATFARGGYNALADLIEKNVPTNERELAANTYLKLIRIAAIEAYNLDLEANKKPILVSNAQSEALINDSLNAFSDMFYYGTPYYLQLDHYDHKQASGMQLTKSPGQKWVYLGSCLLVMGIFAMFYIRERRIWLLIKPATQHVHFAMSSNRKNLDFEQDFDLYRDQIKTLLS